MKKFAVMGHPVAHSLSPTIHQLFADELGLTINYDVIDPGVDGFEAAVADFKKAGGSGLSVTLPFKGLAMQLADRRMPAAEQAGAANTLWWGEQGLLVADNTDGLGLIWDLQQRLKVRLAGARVLIVGAGGATAGILGNLLEQKPHQLIIANRTPEKAEALIARFGADEGSCMSALSLSEIVEAPMDLIIHATSQGHQGLTPLIPEGAIGPNTFCYDLSYGQAAVPFLEWAAGKGAVGSADGLGMLVAQAASQVQRWTGRLPSVTQVFEKIQVV